MITGVIIVFDLAEIMLRVISSECASLFHGWWSVNLRFLANFVINRMARFSLVRMRTDRAIRRWFGTYFQIGCARDRDSNSFLALSRRCWICVYFYGRWLKLWTEHRLATLDWVSATLFRGSSPPSGLRSWSFWFAFCEFCAFSGYIINSRI